MQKAMVTAAVVMALVVGAAGPTMAEEPGSVRAAAVRLAANAGVAQNGMTNRRVRSMSRTWGGVAAIVGGFLLIGETCRDGFEDVGNNECAPTSFRALLEHGDDVGTWNNGWTYAGLGMIGYGTLLATIWADVPVDVRADRHGVSVGRTVGW